MAGFTCGFERLHRRRANQDHPTADEKETVVQEPHNTIRNNIRHYETLLKADSELYTHQNVRKLLAEAKIKLHLAEIEELRSNN